MDPTQWGLPFPIVVAVLFVIVLCRANATYWLGRLAAAGTRRTRVGRLMQRPGYVRAESMITKWGPIAVSISFLTIGIQTLVNLAAGAGRMPMRRYLPAVTVGCVMWAFLYGTVGMVGFESFRILYERSPMAAVAASTLVLAGVAAFVVFTFRKRAGQGAPTMGLSDSATRTKLKTASDTDPG